jgi:hypothetical protein
LRELFINHLLKFFHYNAGIQFSISKQSIFG